MIPLGAVEFSPTDIAILLAILTFGSIVLALPATLTLAWVGYRRGTLRRPANALGYWLGGTALSVITTALAAQQGAGWFAVPLGWIPTLLVAVALNPRWTPNAS
ncbi:hypothetical protein [Kribbella speibonae]|uniref:Uncharacterized protein n=1 Tax=Kribbella speibonae TaxID=1572660 RepID=A0A4R0J474_9ACTN|nr:hypothetical protein [Kribbella speibonae]TCC15972.1 hypothetical protein E0H58_41365 [Kribbella speibonae]TCC41261.1 hypothetical protein E0H92_06235 [Kribbella speibonae]